MDFTRLPLVGNLFKTSSRDYTKTPYVRGVQRFITGEADFLNPSDWNAYDIYITTPQLYAVIQRRGYMLASGKWKHFDKNGEEVGNSEYVKLLNHPNPLVNGKDHIRQMNENKCIYGNNYEYVLKSTGFSEPSGLTNLNPTGIQIETTGKYYKQTELSEIIKAYKLMYGSVVNDTFEPNEINHTRMVNGQNPIVGESPMRALHMPISNIRSAYAFRNVIMNKKGALGLLSNDSKSPEGAIPLTDKERKRLEKEYQKTYGLDDDQLQVIMSNSSLKWQAMSYPTKDLMLFEEVDADFRTLIDAYGLNDNIFSREKGSTFTNLAEGLAHAYQETIIPESEEISMNRTKLFGLDEKDEVLKLSYDHIPVLQEDKAKEAERIERISRAANALTQSGVLERDEIRDVLNFDKENK